MESLNNFLTDIENNFLKKKGATLPEIITSLNEPLQITDFRGISLEISGAEGSGKTKKVYELITEIQKQNYVCILINSDFSFDVKFALECGIKNELLYLFDTADANVIVEILSSLKDCFIFIDSIAGLNMNNMGIRALFGIIKKNHLGLIYTNQLRWKRKGTSSYGTKYLKFYTTKRILLTKEGIQVRK